MEVINDGSARPELTGGCAVTIGAFDGVHLGHRKVIENMLAEAKRRGCAGAVVTFDRHPATVVRPESAPRLLTRLDHKLELLAALGVDYTYVVEFDAERAAELPTDFITSVLVDCLQARYVVVGEDFHFGRGRAGNTALLRTVGPSLGFEAVGLKLLGQSGDNDQVVSSTAIRQALSAGDLDAANAMLGRFHELRGPVEKGDQRGRTLGFPTANVAVSAQFLLPADGVYAGWYIRPDGTRHAAAINVGRRPTFYDAAEISLVEAFLVDFSGDLYGDDAHVRFVARLRPEMRFDGVEALVIQMNADVAETRRLLG